MSDHTYNGWTGNGNKASAYATWRVALEMFDGYEVDESFSDGKPTRNNLADWLREQVDDYVDEYMTEESAGGMIRGWVDAFLDDVNWEEIAEHILIDWDD